MVNRIEETFDASDPLAKEKSNLIQFRCLEGDSIPFACNTRASYCDIACDHLHRLQNGPTKGPETRGHDCSATSIASRINSLKDAEWGEENIVQWATSCSSAYNRIYTDALKYISGRKTSAQSFKRTMNDYGKAKYGAEKWKDYQIDIYETSKMDLVLSAITGSEIDFPLSLLVAFPGSSKFDSPSGMWEDNGSEAVTGAVRWQFGREYHLLLNSVLIFVYELSAFLSVWFRFNAIILCTCTLIVMSLLYVDYYI